MKQLPITRRRALADYLSTHGAVTVAEAVATTAMSTATVRRDFADIVERGLATRVHGGIVAKVPRMR